MLLLDDHAKIWRSSCAIVIDMRRKIAAKERPLQQHGQFAPRQVGFAQFIVVYHGENRPHALCMECVWMPKVVSNCGALSALRLFCLHPERVKPGQHSERHYHIPWHL